MINTKLLSILNYWSNLELIESRVNRGFRKNDEKYIRAKFEHNNFQIDERVKTGLLSKTRLEILPSAVLIKIFSKVTHTDLISIVMAYPNLIQYAFSSIFWKELNAYLDEQVITKEEFRFLLLWYGNSLKTIKFNSTLLIDNESEIIRLNNIRKLQLLNIHSEEMIKLICYNMLRLTDIKLEYINLNDSHIDFIRVSLKSLHSFCFGTSCNVNKGINNLISDMKCIQKFGLKAQSISENTIDYLLRKHNKSLVELYISSKGVLLDDSALKSLKDCKNLRSLLLSNIRLNQPLCDLLDQIDNLENFMFGFHNVSYDYLNVNFHCLLKKPNAQLKNLNLIGFAIQNELFDSIVKNCPSLNTLILESILFTDVARTFDQILQNLESLQIIRSEMLTANHFLRPLFTERLKKQSLKLRHILIDCYKTEDKMEETFNRNIEKIQKVYDIKFIISQRIVSFKQQMVSEDNFENNYLQIS